MAEFKRETKVITTPIDKHKVELKAWLTGFEREEYEKARFNMVKLKEDGQPDINQIKLGDLLSEMTRKAIELVVVSVDDKKEGIIEALLQMKEKDYLFVKEEVFKILGESRFLELGPIRPGGIEKP